MRAAIRRGPTIVCEEIEEQPLSTGQVRVKTLACGICGSDLHAVHHLDRMVELGKRAGGGMGLDPAKDVVFGHEFSAEILEHGPGTQKTLKAGTRVVTVPAAINPAGGMELIGYSNLYPGGYSERMILTEAMLLEVPNGLSSEAAAMTEPFAVGAHAVAKAHLELGSACLVVGCGPVGLAVIAALKARGHGPVIAADFSPTRRRAAEVLGADVIVDPATESPHTHWGAYGVPATLMEAQLARMMGRAVARPIVFECVGAPNVLQSLIEGAPPGAQIVVAGVCMEADRIEPSLAINKELELTFVFGYSPEEFARTLHDIAEGRIDAMAIVTSRVGLAETPAAFARLARPDADVKIVVEPWR